MFLTGILLIAWSAGNYAFDMEDYCGRELSMEAESVYQLELELDDKHMYGKHHSRNGRSCDITIEAWHSSWTQLMLYFDDLDLDCSDGYLQFFAGEKSHTRVKGLEKDICGNDTPDGVFTVDSRYLRINYVSKSRKYVGDVFSIIVTSYSDDTCPSKAFECDNSRCIENGLKCNGYDSCGDGSFCDSSTVNVGAIIGISIGCLVGLALVICAIICCVCCTRKSGKSRGVVQVPGSLTVTYMPSGQLGLSQPTYGVNQGGPYGGNTPNAPPYPVGPQAVPTNIAAGQAPAYSANCSKPPYEQIHISDQPPPYTELYVGSQSYPQGRTSLHHDTVNNTVAVENKQQLHEYSELNNVRDDHTYNSANQMA